MIFERTESLGAEQLPVQPKHMFRQQQYFAFMRSSVPALSVDTATLGSARLCRVRSTGHEVGLIEPDQLSVLMPRQGTIEVTTARSTFTAKPGETLLFAPNRRVSRVLPDRTGRFACDCILMPASAADVAEARLEEGRLGAPTGLERSYPVAGAAGAVTALRQYVDLLIAAGTRRRSFLAAGSARSAAAVLLIEMVAELIAEMDGELPAQPIRAAERRLVEAAEAIMRARLEEPLAIQEVASALGVGARRLQYAFQRVRGTTARAVLGELRLELARQRLSEPTEACTVTQVALECGIAHFGRFAGAYSARYGESPSQTLRRARRPLAS